MNDIHDSQVKNAASNGASHGTSGIIAARRLVTDSARRANIPRPLWITWAAIYFLPMQSIKEQRQ